MAERNATNAPLAGARSVAGELRRYAWMSAAALMAIAVTVAISAPATAILIVCAEVLLVLVALSAFMRQIVRQARALETQRSELERQTRHAMAQARQKVHLAGLLDAALDNAPVGFAFFGRDLRFLRVNERLARLNGLAPEDHIGATLRDIDPVAADQVEPLLHRVLEHREPVLEAEFIHTPRGGREMRQVVASFYPIVSADGELFAIGAVAVDVTEWKRLEAQLRQAQKMEAVGRLAGGVAHDFNNLLTVISSYTELMMGSATAHENRDEIAEIRAATTRAAKLTRQLLAFSRRQALEPQILNPNDVLRALEPLTRRIVLGHIDITLRLSPETPLVRVDPGQLEQVVMNLAINAADAMPDGGELSVETSGAELGEGIARMDPDLSPGHYAVIRVRDTGMGMDEATMGQIFEPFFTTKEPGRGTGLGLSTVYGIVRQSGGHIAVESTPGGGSVFTVYLPAVGEPAQPAR